MKKTHLFLMLLAFMQFSGFSKNPATDPVEISTRLTEDYPIEMPNLVAYPIYVTASVGEPLAIEVVTLSINGTEFTAEEDRGFFYHLWTPEAYGNYEIEMTAQASDGSSASITKEIEVVASASSQMVRSLEDVVIEFEGDNSRWFYGTYTFPQHVGAYNELIAFLDVACPRISGGCDDWDRWAFIDVKAPDGNWVQLIRYITPYGVACNHQLEITDYASLLQGEVELRVFIDTWGTGGWQLTLDTHYSQGAPQYMYSDVVEVWDDEYPFGDPSNLQPVPTFQVDLPEQILASHLRISNTGHGWGSNNSQNAAEFFPATHFIDIDGTETFTQRLWNQCNPNPDGCTGQRGTWQHNRAGWCPGAISVPHTFDLSPYIGSQFALDYRFHPSYVDRCHPNNPDCVSGSTCPDCNDDFNPVYYVDTHIINFSNNPIVYGNTLNVKPVDNVAQYEINLYPNPSKDYFKIKTSFPEGSTRMTINAVDGQALKTYYFSTSEDVNNFDFDISNLSSGIYYISIQNSYGTGVKTLVVN